MCSWEILRPIKNIFAHYHSPCNHKTYQGGHIPQGGSSHPWTPMTLYWSCHVTPRGKLNTSYLQLYKTRGHQTRQDADLQWEVPILIALWPFDLVTKLSSLEIWKIDISTMARHMVSKLGRVPTYGRKFSTQTFNSSPTFCFSFLFFLFIAFSGRTGKSFLSNFCQLFLQTCITKIRSSSLDNPTNYCVYVLIFLVC